MIRKTTALVLGICIMLFNCLENPYEYSKPQKATIVINEFMAANNLGIFTDDYGDASDWIELYNHGDESVSLSGLYLSDDSTKLFQYALPEITLKPKEFVVIWADDDTDKGPLHAPFKLSATRGEEIILTVVNGLVIDRIQFFAHSGNPEARIPDVSYGRSPDGSSNWKRQEEPTPKKRNLK